MKKSTFIALGLLATFLSATKAQDAGQILEASGIRGGLVVVIGCDSPALLAQLRAGGSYLVHGLDRDPEKVAAARTYLAEKGLYGPVTAARWNGMQLPLVDHVVNLIVVTGDMGRISRHEMMRVLAPLGVIADARHGRIETTRNPWPAQLDEWTHYLHDASNHAVSKDTVVAPPRGLQWTCGPEYARSHEHFASVSAMVTAGGRVFYIIDEGPISSVYLPPKWRLVARDAFNGVLLWKKPIANWESHLRGFRSGPPEIGRRLVAGGDRVYVSLGYGEPVTVLDAASGKPLKTLPGTGGARELLLAGDVLYVLADDMTADDHEERKKRIDRVWPTLEMWYRFPRKALPMYGTQRIVAIETGTGEPLWKRQFEAPGEILPATMAADGGKVCLQTVSHVVCLDAATGKELWRNRRPVATSRLSWSTPTLVIYDGVVLCLDRTAGDNAGPSPPERGSEWIISSGGFETRQNAELVAYSLDDGKELWRAPCSENYNTPGDVFVIGGVVWVGDLRGGGDPGFTRGRDLSSGRIVATIPAQKAWGHHRCYRNKATVRWLMVGRGGIQFIDPKSGSVQGNSWVRGTCQYGTMPANGLIYAPQHSCACQPEEMLIGLNALSPRSSAGEAAAPLETGPARLEHGPAYLSSPSGRGAGGEGVSAECAWPTYRRDVQRSGYQDLPAPDRPDIVWTRKLSPPITPPVVAGGLVFVAETDRHRLHALSATDGRPVWTFVADGRIDSPPTLSPAMCLFGTRGGFVYCLRAADGALVWRFRAAPRDRRLVAYEQLESVWPVHGSVLVDDRLSGGVPVAYFAAGRSARIDGGIRLYALQVTTGNVLHKADVSVGGRAHGAGVIRQSVLPDILSLQKGTLWMRGLGVDKNLVPVADRPHLFAPRGFLDDTWWHRTYWVYGTQIGGGYTHWPLVGNVVPAGRLLTFDDGKLIYGYGRMAYQAGKGHVRPDMAKDYKLFAEVREPAPKVLTRVSHVGRNKVAEIRAAAAQLGESEQAPRHQTNASPATEVPAAAEVARSGLPAGEKSGAKPSQKTRQIKWTASLPFVARAIVLCRDALLIAGGKSPTETAERHGPGTFWIASREDGSRRTACALPAPPVLDGMALTDAGIFVSSIDGTVVCLRTQHHKAGQFDARTLYESE